MTTWRKRTGKKKDQFTGPDEFQSFTQKALLYVQENIRKFYIGLAVLAVVIIASALGFMVMKSTHEESARPRWRRPSNITTSMPPLPETSL